MPVPAGLTPTASAVVTRVGALEVIPVQMTVVVFPAPAERSTRMGPRVRGGVKQRILIIFSMLRTSGAVFEIFIEFVMRIGRERVLGLIFDAVGCPRSGAGQGAVLAVI
jgi:hypothetical protein